MSNPVQTSTASASRESLPSRYPRIATLVVVSGLFAVSTGLLYATVLAVATSGGPLVALAASAWLLSVLVLALTVRPYFYRLKTDVRSVPEGLDVSVESGCARNGVAVRRSWLTPDAPDSRPVEIIGLLPWDRHFVVDEWFFASLSSTEREALVAREAALVRRRFQLFSHLAGPLVVAGVAGLLALSSFLQIGVGWTNTLLLLGVICAFLYGIAVRQGTRKVYAADRRAARETNPEAVVGLLETADMERDASIWQQWPLSVLVMRPTTKKRIEHLQSNRG